jgi:GTP diphosphokinase / guanosine-3',5'-bis(diphosphate) 3'-diphosphatase
MTRNKEKKVRQTFFSLLPLASSLVPKNTMNNLANLLQAISFSAKKHRYQTRKGVNGEPYINHPIEVANILANVGKVTDFNTLIAAVLHDTVEDTETTAEELTNLFGEKVCSIVMEVTDDKLLPKHERKLLQIEHSPHISPEAKQVKLADKISNVSDILNNPPDWSEERKREYIVWAKKVVAGLRGVNADLDELFDKTVSTGESF